LIKKFAYVLEKCQKTAGGGIFFTHTVDRYEIVFAILRHNKPMNITNYNHLLWNSVQDESCGNVSCMGK